MRKEVPDPPGGLRAADPREWMRVWARVLAEPSVKNTGAWMAHFADYKNGATIHPGNELLAKVTGLSDKAVRDALKVIRDWGLIWRYLEGSKAPFVVTRNGRKRPSDEYRLTFPDDASGIPMLSPDMGDDWEAEFLALWTTLWITLERRYSLPVFAVPGGEERRYSLPVNGAERR